jgi:hypothetical protein
VHEWIPVRAWCPGETYFRTWALPQTEHDCSGIRGSFFFLQQSKAKCTSIWHVTGGIPEAASMEKRICAVYGRQCHGIQQAGIMRGPLRHQLACRRSLSDIGPSCGFLRSRFRGLSSRTVPLRWYFWPVLRKTLQVDMRRVCVRTPLANNSEMTTQSNFNPTQRRDMYARHIYPSFFLSTLHLAILYNWFHVQLARQQYRANVSHFVAPSLVYLCRGQHWILSTE